MAVTKRTRYEVLKRDNHTCRYCGGTAPDVKLTVDHVTPVALGGTDKPDNLVAACRDCNYGKASTSPEAALVDDVKQADIKWAKAMQRVAAARGRQRKKAERYLDDFETHWNTWTWSYNNAPFPLDDNWRTGIRRFYELGVPMDDLKTCVDVACGNNKVSGWETYRYFAGCVWRVVTEMQEDAKSLLESEVSDGA